MFDTHVNRFSPHIITMHEFMNLNSVSSRGSSRPTLGAPTRLDDSLICRRMLIALFFFLSSACISARPAHDHRHEKHAGTFGEDGHPALRSHGRATCRLRVVPGRPQVRRCHWREPTLSLSCSTAAQKCSFWTLRVKQPDRWLCLVILLIFNQRRRK